MEKKMFGIILTILGIAGLIGAAVNFINGTSGAHGAKLIATFLILGGIFFFAGIGLIKGTKDNSV
jgi:uncharacterized membrane protein